MKFKPAKANKHYAELELYAEARRQEIGAMAEPYRNITDRYGRLISRLVLMLGTRPPVNTQDGVIRDLIADVFDALYESRSLILSGKLVVAFPLGRRAFESLSLLHACIIDGGWAEKWEAGKEIGNAELRKALGQHPLGEPESAMKDLYKFYCEATHPNRDLVPKRFLGDGNQYVLGMIGKPELALVCDYCSKNLEMWFWLTAAVSYFYRETITEIDRTYHNAYGETAKEAANVKKWLVENYETLIAESLTELRSNAKSRQDI